MYDHEIDITSCRQMTDHILQHRMMTDVIVTHWEFNQESITWKFTRDKIHRREITRINGRRKNTEEKINSLENIEDEIHLREIIPNDF